MTWAQAAEAAKTVDADPVMAAIETKEFQSVRGPIRIGKFDHQAEVPVFIGKVAQNAKFGQPVLDIVEMIPGPKARPSEEEVLKLRGAK
jgi:branched-chain amino acid transport system substrate-binding protein